MESGLLGYKKNARALAPDGRRVNVESLISRERAGSARVDSNSPT